MPSAPARVISASRRTDIPAFYAEWFMRRIRAGFCRVPNPFNAGQVSRVSLLPQDVDAIVFWTRNPRPLLAHLDELDRLGYRYYFQFTLLDSPRWLETATPPVEAALKTFAALTDRVGPERVVWRYDPMVFTPATDAAFHRRTFERLAAALQGSTHRVVISVMDEYPKAAARMRQAAAHGGGLQRVEEPLPEWFGELVAGMRRVSQAHGMEIVTCAERLDLTPFGVLPGSCIDGDLITRLFGLQIDPVKDPSQRAACRCVLSKDIGVYDTCGFGCAYCYATRSFETARRRHAAHDPEGDAITLSWGNL